MIKIGLFTDVHYGEGEKVNRNCAAGLKKIGKLMEVLADCDLVINLGDTVNGGDPPERMRERWEEIRMLPGYDRVITLIGNHDAFALEKERIRLIDDPSVGSVFRIDTEGVSLLFLDANFYTDGRPYDGTPGDWTNAAIPPPQLLWIAEQLRECKKAIVFLHHCLVNRKIDASSPEDPTDPECIRNAAEVRKILEESGKVRQVVMGHAHQDDCIFCNGISYHVLNAACIGNDVPYTVAKLENGVLSFYSRTAPME